MDNTEAAEQALNSEAKNPCCDEWKEKYSKLQEARNALRQAVKLLEQRNNQIEADNVNLKKAHQKEQERMNLEKEEKMKEYNARLSLENEVAALKSEITTLRQKVGADCQDGNCNVQALQACLSDRETEIRRLKELLEKERIRANSESKTFEREKMKAAEICKLLEAEKNRSAEKGKQLARIEAEKAEEYRLLQARLGKEVNEAKMKLVSEMSKFKEATKRFEAEKKKLFADKRNSVSEMAKVEERIEAEIQKAAQEKKRADAEMIKAEQHKKLAEDNRKKAVEAKLLADEMSQKLEEDKRTIEDLKQKIHGLSSLRNPKEISRPSDNALSTKVRHLESHLKIERLQAKIAKKKYQLEARRHNNLQRELGRLKSSLIQIFGHLDMLDASFSPVVGGIYGLTKSENMPNMQKSNVTSDVCNLSMSQKHSQVENDFVKPCSPKMSACNPIRKNMQYSTFLALSGGNYADSITGINIKSGSDGAKLRSSTVNSVTTSLSDGQVMGSQEKAALQVAKSTKLAQENLNAIASISNPSNRSDIGHDKKRKRITDSVECTENLSKEGKKLKMQLEDNLSDLLPRKRDKSVEEQREMVSYHKDKIQSNNDSVGKKRKKCDGPKVCLNGDEKRVTVETNSGVCEDENGCNHTPYLASHTSRTTQACRQRIIDAPNNFDSMICFNNADKGDFIKLLDLENVANEECYRRAVEVPLSPSLPEIEAFEMDNLKPLLEEAPHEDLLSQRGLFAYPPCDIIDVEISSNKQKFNVITGPSDTHHVTTQASKTDAKLPEMQTSENLQTTLPSFCFVLTNIEDSSIMSRTFCATKNIIARCKLDTQTEWAVDSILTAVEAEKMCLQKEKHFVLFTLFLFNFTKATAMKFGRLWKKNLVFCLNSYAEHICKVLTGEDTRTLFLEKFSLQELLCLIEDFLIKGNVIYKNMGPTDISKSNSRTESFLEGADSFYFEEASCELLVAGSIIFASLCAATDHVGFILEASYNILRFCRQDFLMVLTILHIFANLGGRKFFDSSNFDLSVMVLKSVVMFLEGKGISVTSASCFSSINQLHTALCASVACPFSEGSESIDIVLLLLLEKIKKFLLEGAEQDKSSNLRSLLDSCNAGKWSNQEVVQCPSGMKCDVRCCLKTHMISPTQPDVLINFTMCQLSDILSLLELVANTMSWQWTNIKLVPQLFSMLDSCVVENFAVAIIIFLGQLGRLGVDVGGYEDQDVENLRGNLCSYLCRNSSMKAVPLQIATATALFGLLPLDFKTLLHTKFSLSACSIKSVSYAAEELKKWFFGLGKDQQDLLCDSLGGIDKH